MNDKYKILHLEDISTDAELVARVLKESNIDFDHLVIDSENEYLEALYSFAPDIILCDHTLPSFNSFEALRIIKERKLNIPFIVITATMTEDVAMTVVREGADDYILKDRLQRLPHAVINAIEKYRFEKERHQFIGEYYVKEALSKEILRRLSNKLLLATKVAGVGIWEYTIHTKEFIGDEVMMSLYGITPENFDGRYETWKHFLHPEDAARVDAQFQNALKNDTQFDLDFRIIHPDRSLHYIEGSAIIERDNEGKPLRVVGTNQDVTARKKAELAIQKNIEERELLIRELTSSIKDLKQFSFITSHNFRAPLSNLIGLLRIVDYSTLTEANNDILEMFKVSTLQLNKTINDLVLVLIIKDNVNVNIVDNNINDLLDDVCNSLAYDINETGCAINKDLQVKNISFNKTYLESILLNLLSNAIKYRSPNRSLKIDISTQQKSNGEVLMVIKDNGIGIDLNLNRNKIFGLYQRFHSNVDSVGLGLFIVKSQIIALGGDIDIESEVDEGTSFHITFRQKKVDEIAGNSVASDVMSTLV